MHYKAPYNRIVACSGQFVKTAHNGVGHKGDFVLYGSGGYTHMQFVVMHPTGCCEPVDGRTDSLGPQVTNVLTIESLSLAGLFDGLTNDFAHRYRVATFHAAMV